MNILIVYAHPESGSLNGTLKELAVNTLEDKGHQVQVSDLYAMKFKAVLDQKDFPERMDTQRFNPIMEQQHAMEKDAIPIDIKQEMDKVLWADLIIFQFPIWWSNFPAILKGWIDRVFYNGFAFNLARMQIYEKGPLKGKKAMLSFTTGATKDLYSEGGPHGDFEQILNYFQHVLIEFVGMEALPYFGIFGPMSMDEEELENQIALFQSIMESL